MPSITPQSPQFDIGMGRGQGPRREHPLVIAFVCRNRFLNRVVESRGNWKRTLGAGGHQAAESRLP